MPSLRLRQCKQRASADARREIALREERETLQKEVLKLQEEPIEPSNHRESHLFIGMNKGICRGP